MGFFVFMNFFALRVNLSVAIIAMFNSSFPGELHTNVSSNKSSGLSGQDQLRATNDNSSTLSIHDDHDDDDVRI